MSDRPTPETDAARHDMTDYGPPVLCSWGDWVPADIAARLEQERDEAMEKLSRVLKLLNDYDQAVKNPSSPFWDAFKKWFTWEAAK